MIRFALLEAPREVNAWALFDEAGSSYANRALRSSEYPSLYRLSIPAREFEPYLAEGMPSSVTPLGSLFTAQVTLKPGLYWSDGSPLTAADVAFTASTALAFRLRLDWASAYNPALLDSVAAAGERTLEFTFKAPFNVGDWQYGVLQGPILSRAYWSPRLADPESLLPSADLAASVESTRLQAAAVQSQIDADDALLRLTPPNSESYKEVSGRLTRSQNELNSLNARTAKLQDEYDAALGAARSALFALPDENEPVFGPFLRAARKGSLFSRLANPAFPFGDSSFEAATYALYPSLDSAVEALERNLVDAILDPRGLPRDLISGSLQNDPALVVASNSIRSARFLVFNPLNAILTDPALRRALSCVIDRARMARSLGVIALDSFVLPVNGSWYKAAAGSSCALEEDLSLAVETLKRAGYRWNREPSENEPGSGLLLPDGSPFPALSLLASSEEADPQTAAAADSLVASFSRLGLAVSVRPVSAEDLRYALFSTGDYDLALLGLQLADYPAYLCDWFVSPGAFAPSGAGLEEVCRSMRFTADLETARQAAYHIQSVLMEQLPFLPLYQGVIYEAYRGVSYPFDFVPGGLAGLYGAPGLAVPVQ